MFGEIGSRRNGSPWVKVLPVVLVAIGLCVLATACGSATSPSVVSTVTVTGAAPAVGSSSQYAAVANMSNGTTENVTTTATWTSSNADIATVSAGGLVTAITEGTVAISATFDNITGSTQAAVPAAAASE
jgi:hypothetical protein